MEIVIIFLGLGTCLALTLAFVQAVEHARRKR